jgi:hypothetical protein
MTVSIDGGSRIITPDGPPVDGLIHLNAIDIYSWWKQWVKVGTNSQWAPAFRVVGGDPITGNNSLTPYFFLINDWKIRPYEASHQFEIDGALVVEGGGYPVVPTIGPFNVATQLILPLQANDVGGTAILTSLVEPGITMEETLRILLAVAAGKTTITDLGGGSASVVFRDTGDTKNRVSAGMTGSERTSVTLDKT